MFSMTGFGSGEFQNEEFQIAIEVKSYNNRYLDISFNIPSYMSVYELQLKEAIKEYACRGHIDLSIRVRRLSSELEILVDKGVIAAYQKALQEIVEITGIHDKPTLNTYLQAEDLLKFVKKNNVEMYFDPLFELLHTVLADFQETRKSEGLKTLLDIKEQLRSFENSYVYVAQRAVELEDLIKNNLKDRITALLTNDHYDESRFHQEVAMLLMKYTINEELQRIESHLTHFKTEMESDGPVGKRLDFLCQELNREINTIGSKSVIVEINQAVVTMKDNLENIREQLRNVE